MKKLDFSNMFKNCVNLTTLPSFDGLITKMLYHTDSENGYITYKGKHISGELIEQKNITEVQIITSKHPLYKELLKEFPELFL